MKKLNKKIQWEWRKKGNFYFFVRIVGKKEKNICSVYFVKKPRVLVIANIRLDRVCYGTFRVNSKKIKDVFNEIERILRKNYIIRSDDVVI